MQTRYDVNPKGKKEKQPFAVPLKIPRFQGVLPIWNILFASDRYLLKNSTRRTTQTATRIAPPMIHITFAFFDMGA